jgi:fucose permease
VISVFLTSAALFGFSRAGSLAALCIFAIPYGFGAGAIDASLNNFVALHYSSRHMSWLHCFWGVGAVISPYIMSFALTHSSWNDGYLSVSLIQLVIFLALLFTLPLWRKIPSTTGEGENGRPMGLIDALRIRGVKSVLFAFMAYCATESVAMLWASSYLEDSIGLSKDRAAAFGALFFIGMTVGRFISGFISERLGDLKMISFGCILAMIGGGLLLIPTEISSVVGLIIFGLGCAPVYPSIIHMTPERFGRERSQGIIGVQMASAYLGSTLAPPIFGLIGEHISLGLMPILLIGFITLTLLLIQPKKQEKKSL